MIKLQKRKYERVTYPTLPYKRELTFREYQILRENFGSQNSPGGWHSWTQVDANGHIILGGGDESCGLYYVTEDDLSDKKDWKPSEKYQKYFKIHQTTIMFKPMTENGKLSFEEDDEDEIIISGLSLKEQVEMVEEFKRLFGLEKIKDLDPITELEFYDLV